MRKFGMAAVAAFFIAMSPGLLHAASTAVALPGCGNCSVTALVTPSTGGSVVFTRDWTVEEDNFTIDFIVDGVLYINGAASGNFDLNGSFEVTVMSFGAGNAWILDVTVMDLADGTIVASQGGIGCEMSVKAKASGMGASISVN